MKSTVSTALDPSSRQKARTENSKYLEWSFQLLSWASVPAKSQSEPLGATGRLCPNLSRCIKCYQSSPITNRQPCYAQSNHTAHHRQRHRRPHSSVFIHSRNRQMPLDV